MFLVKSTKKQVLNTFNFALSKVKNESLKILNCLPTFFVKIMSLTFENEHQ